MYDVAIGRLSRDLRRLPISLGHATARGDKRAMAYLERRQERARRLARQTGVITDRSHDYIDDLMDGA